MDHEIEEAVRTFRMTGSLPQKLTTTQRLAEIGLHPRGAADCDEEVCLIRHEREHYPVHPQVEEVPRWDCVDG